MVADNFFLPDVGRPYSDQQEINFLISQRVNSVTYKKHRKTFTHVQREMINSIIADNAVNTPVHIVSSLETQRTGAFQKACSRASFGLSFSGRKKNIFKRTFENTVNTSIIAKLPQRSLAMPVKFTLLYAWIKPHRTRHRTCIQLKDLTGLQYSLDLKNHLANMRPPTMERNI